MPLPDKNLEKHNLHSTSTVKLYGCQGEFCENEDEDEDLTFTIPQHSFNINLPTQNFDASLHIAVEFQPVSGQTYAKCLQTTSHTEFVGEFPIRFKESVMGSAMVHEKSKETQNKPIRRESPNTESPPTRKIFMGKKECSMAPDILVSGTSLSHVKSKVAQNYQSHLGSVRKLNNESISLASKFFLRNNECVPVIEDILTKGVTTVSDLQKRKEVRFTDDTLKNGTNSVTSYPNINTLALSQMLTPNIKRSVSSNKTQKEGSRISDECSIAYATNNNSFPLQSSTCITQGKPFQTWYSRLSTKPHSNLICSHASIPRTSSHSKMSSPSITSGNTSCKSVSDSRRNESIMYQESNLKTLTGHISHLVLHQMMQLHDILGNTIERLVNGNPNVLYTGSVNFSCNSKSSSIITVEKLKDIIQEESTEGAATSNECYQVCSDKFCNNGRKLKRFLEDASTSSIPSEWMTLMEKYSPMVNETLDDREPVTRSRIGSFIPFERNAVKTQLKNQDTTTSRVDKSSTSIESNGEDTNDSTICLPGSRTILPSVQSIGKHTTDSANIDHETIDASDAPTIVPMPYDKDNISTQDDNINASTPPCKICEKLRNDIRNTNDYATPTSNSSNNSSISQQFSSTSIESALKEMQTKVISHEEKNDLLSSTSQQMEWVQDNEVFDTSMIDSSNCEKINKSNENSTYPQTGFDTISILCQQNAEMLNGMNNTVLIYSAHARNKLYGAKTSNLQIDRLKSQQQPNITSIISHLCISDSNALIFPSSVTCMSLPLINQRYHGFLYSSRDYYSTGVLASEEQDPDDEIDFELSFVTSNTQLNTEILSQSNQISPYSYPFIRDNEVIIAPEIVLTEDRCSCSDCRSFIDDDDDDDVSTTGQDILYKPSAESMPPCSICLTHQEECIRPTPEETQTTQECHSLSTINAVKELKSQDESSVVDLSIVSGRIEQKTSSVSCVSSRASATSNGSDGEEICKTISSKSFRISETSDDIECKDKYMCISCGSSRILRMYGGIKSEKILRDISGKLSRISETSCCTKGITQSYSESSIIWDISLGTDGNNNSRCVSREPSILSEISSVKEHKFPYGPTINSLPQNNKKVFPIKCSSPQITPIPVDETSDCVMKSESPSYHKMYLQTSSYCTWEIPIHKVRREDSVTDLDSITRNKYSSVGKNKIKLEDALDEVTCIECDKSLNRNILTREEFNEENKGCVISNFVIDVAESDLHLDKICIQHSKENNVDCQSILRKQDVVSTIIENQMFTIPSSCSDYRMIVSRRDLTNTTRSDVIQCPNKTDTTACVRCHSCTLREIPGRTRDSQMLEFPLTELYDLQKELIAYMPISKISDLVYELQQELERYTPVLQGEICAPHKESETFIKIAVRKDKNALQNGLERYKKALKFIEKGNKLNKELDLDESSSKLESHVTDPTSSPEKRGQIRGLGGTSVDTVAYMREVNMYNAITRHGDVSENELTSKEANINIPLSQHFVTLCIKPTNERFNTSNNLISKLQPAAKRELRPEPLMQQPCGSSQEEMPSRRAQALVASFHRDPNEEPTSLEPKWALARVNIFGDGSRVLEILHTASDPPEELTIQDINVFKSNKRS